MREPQTVRNLSMEKTLSLIIPQERLPMMKENVSNFNMTCIVDVERDRLTDFENKIFQLAENHGGIEVFKLLFTVR